MIRYPLSSHLIHSIEHDSWQVPKEKNKFSMPDSGCHIAKNVCYVLINILSSVMFNLFTDCFENVITKVIVNNRTET